MRRFIMIFILLALVTGQTAYAASLVSSVDRQQISEDETINLTITLDDASFSGNPDVNGLTSHFQIINQRTGSSTTIINGNYNSKKEWHYTLLPLHAGKLLIPSFKLKNIFSEAIEVEVLAAGTSKNNSGNGNNDAGKQSDLYIEQKIDKTEACVQEELTLTLRIFTAIRIERPEIAAPSLPDFMVEKLAQAEYQTNQNGRSYYVLEYKFALFPNKSGVVVLPKQRYQINQIMDNGPRSLFDIQGFGSPMSQPRFLSTPELTLNIKPQPDNLPVPYWLPSEDITISDNWSEQQTVDVGTALTRTIEIKALGNLAAHIPPLPALAINGLKSYAEQPELSNTHTGDHFLASRKENIAIVPTLAGTYILPAIQLHWWNTKTKQFRVSTLAERTLTVKATTNITSPTTQQMPGNSPPTGQQDPATFIAPISSTPASSPFYMNVYVWMAAAAFFVILWIVTFIVMVNRKNKPGTEAPSAASVNHQESVKDILKQLKIACRDNNAKVVRQLLIHLTQLQCPNADISTLEHVKHQMNNASFTKLADELDACLYRASGSWKGKLLLDFLESGKLQVTTHIKPAVLPGLYS